ncbi:MAG: ATP-dependent RNA helicase [Treponema sp.]|jgi:HrpA-like RNA helicase|nr:ATP-dependent RNA helicase [Treponema sp.]
MNYSELPVYKHKERILAALENNQTAVVESPTGSGKTTQLPVILNDAGYGMHGIIGVTQPRRIAAVSVSEFIARQLGTRIPGIVGYKMRFEDKTNQDTKIKIMTDGILLQEMKLDPWLSKYSCIVVDEAHERSLNIDFILGLLKRILEIRKEFKVIVSSATINAEVFSEYFGECPIVKIEAQTFPVTLIYDPPAVDSIPNNSQPMRDGRKLPGTSSSTGNTAEDALLGKIESIVERFISEERKGDILIFLSGEKMIKECMKRLTFTPAGAYLHLIPLYGRLGKEEQEKVFEEAPQGKTKTVISTNIAETSLTIDGITAVIDSGFSKLNYYNPRTFTSSLIEAPISKASANQRKGRAGRTREGTCYRLYNRKDFENRILFTVEEIYRTDLSEVVLRMAELGIIPFEEFDFISPPGREGLIAAIETLNLLGALEKDNTLSRIGKLMTEFPLAPRQSRIIVEAILKYPNLIEETIIAAAFLSTQSPYILPPGEETDARQAHHRFRDPDGDFVSYLKLYHAYMDAPSKTKFSERNYLDEKAMAEIANVVFQLEEIVSALKIPILSGGSVEDYLCAVARGFIQFVCVREGRDMYRTLTADRILIHPGSVMFKMDPQFIVAGEIVRTTRMYAMSVSPLSKSALEKISPQLFSTFGAMPDRRERRKETVEKTDQGRIRGAKVFANHVGIGSEVFEVENIKGKKHLLLPWEKCIKLKKYIEEINARKDPLYKGLRGTIVFEDTYTLLRGEKLKTILTLLPALDLSGVIEKKWPAKKHFNSWENLEELLEQLPILLSTALWRKDRKELGFLSLCNDGEGVYRIVCTRGFHTGLNESLASLEALIDEMGEEVDIGIKHIVNQTYRRLSDLI